MDKTNSYREKRIACFPMIRSNELYFLVFVKDKAVGSKILFEDLELKQFYK